MEYQQNKHILSLFKSPFCQFLSQNEKHIKIEEFVVKCENNTQFSMILPMKSIHKFLTRNKNYQQKIDQIFLLKLEIIDEINPFNCFLKNSDKNKKTKTLKSFSWNSNQNIFFPLTFISFFGIKFEMFNFYKVNSEESQSDVLREIDKECPEYLFEIDKNDRCFLREIRQNAKKIEDCVLKQNYCDFSSESESFTISENSKMSSKCPDESRSVLMIIINCLRRTKELSSNFSLFFKLKNTEFNHFENILQLFNKTV